MKRLQFKAVASGAVASIIVGLLTLQHLPPAAASAEFASTPISFVRLSSGTAGNLTGRVNYVLHSQDQLKTLWKMIGASSTPPVIDFSTNEVLAVLSDGGEKVAVASIADARDAKQRIVSVVVTKPEGACALKADAATYELIAVSAASLPLTHADIVAPATCSH